MLQFEVNAQMRKNFGKGAARQLRRAGKTPAVLYGSGISNMPLEVETKPLTKTLLTIQDQNAVISLKIGESSENEIHHVLIKEVQVDPIKDSLVHADFLEIDLEKPRTLAVPIKFTGKAKGVDMGGEMVISRTSVMLHGKILDIPNEITANVSGLGLGGKITYKEFELPSGVTLADKGDTVVVLVQEASGKQAEAEAETESEAEAGEAAE